MPYTLPTFNLNISVWTNGGIVPPVGAATFKVDGQLRYPGRGAMDLLPTITPEWVPEMRLLVPKLTDLRDPHSPMGPSVVEVPTGSGRIYVCWVVDDVAKGFINEYRMAWLAKEGTWPAPVP